MKPQPELKMIEFQNGVSGQTDVFSPSGALNFHPVSLVLNLIMPLIPAIEIDRILTVKTFLTGGETKSVYA
jgi:hypothetical protein